jgi:hypothetical protein
VVTCPVSFEQIQQALRSLTDRAAQWQDAGGALGEFVAANRPAHSWEMIQAAWEGAKAMRLRRDRQR